VGAADCFEKAGDPSRTIAAYERVLEDPLPPQTAATVLMRMGEAGEASGLAARAAESYARVVREYPFTDSFQQAASKRDMIAGHVTLDWSPYDAYGRASRQLRAGEFAGAIAACDTVMAATQDAPLRASAEYVRTVSQMMQSGDFEGGQGRLTAFVEANPAFRGLAGVERTMRLAANASAAQANARQRPEDAGAQRDLGQAYLNARLFQRALEPLEKARALAPDHMGTQMMLGGAYISTGQFDKADEAYKAALETDPNNATTLNLIGYAYLGRGAAEQAIAYFERYAQLAPDDPNSHDSLGEGYLGAGRTADAIREYEKAVEIDPGFANSHFMLGGVYLQAGQPEKALAAYRRFLQLSPTGPQADQAREAISGIESR
jgi:tetratricopeptide (TPR) repeat protein